MQVGRFLHLNNFSWVNCSVSSSSILFYFVKQILASFFSSLVSTFSIVSTVSIVSTGSIVSTVSTVSIVSTGSIVSAVSIESTNQQLQ